MKLINEINIFDNDVYVLSQSHNYVVVNDNYKGIVIYDSDLQYVKSIAFNNELMVYQIFSSDLNDVVVISDVENEKLFIVDLSNKNANIIETDRDEIFLEYYYVNKNHFFIRDATNRYKISFVDGAELSYEKSRNLNILANNEYEEIYEENGEVFYRKDSDIRKIKKAYDNNTFFSLYNEIIVEYSENDITICNMSEVLSEIEVDSNWVVRKVIIRRNILLILLNNKITIYESKIQKYRI